MRQWWGRAGGRVLDVVFIVACTAIAADQIHTGHASGLVTNSAVSIALAAAAVVSLWWRRSRTVLVTMLAVVVLGVTGLYGFAVVALFTLAMARRDRTLVMLTVAAWGAALIGTAGSDGLDAGAIAGITVIVGLAVLAGGYLGVRRDLLESLRTQVRQAQAERDLRDRQAQISERTRIAGEMHDILAHKVSLIALHAGSLEVNPAAGPSEVERAAALIGSTARQALGDLRDVLGVLRTDQSAGGDDLAPQPGLVDIERLVSASRAAGVSVTYECALTSVPDVVGRTAYRVVQEALTNVHKHAAGARASVCIKAASEHEVDVQVLNGVPSADRASLPGSGSGLVGLRERVELLGGVFQSGPTAVGGWMVSARIPGRGVIASVEGAAT